MGITLDVEQRLQDVGVVDFYDATPNIWKAMAQDAYDYTRNGFPDGQSVRRDDVSKALKPVIEVDENYHQFREQNKLRPKYWVTDFCDLVIDRCWDELVQDYENGEQ